MNAPFGWPGGKKNLVQRLIRIIPPHEIYVEVFCGSAKLFFSKEPSPREIINDLDGDLMNFFRVAKHRPDALAEMFEATCVHGGIFKDLRSCCHKCWGDLERAFRFAYMVWYSFGSKGEHFARWKPGQNKATTKKSIAAVEETLRRTAERLRSALIDNSDFADVLRRYDTPETFFYCDPPYVNFQSNGRYTAMPWERQVELFKLLSRIRGRFLMSHEDCDQVRELCAKHGFITERVETQYTMASAGNKPVRELLIANYKFQL